MNGFFDPENGLFRTLSTMVDIVGLSLLWVLLCLPVITAVPATAALYHTVVYCVRGEDTRTFQRFFRSLWQNLRQGCLLSIPVAVLGGALMVGYDALAALANTQGGYAVALYMMYHVLMVVPAGLALWLAALLGRFTFPTGELCSTALVITLRHLPTTVAVVLVVLASLQLCLRALLLCFAVPALAALVLSLLMERVFARYMPPKEEPPEESL